MAGTLTRQIGALGLAVLVVSLGACKKDADVISILATVDSFTTELVRRIEMAGNLSEGIDDAQKYFELRRADISANLNDLKRFNGNQVSDETKQKMKASLLDDASKVGNLQIKYVSRSMSDPAFKAKLDKLVKDYQSLLTR